MQAVKVSPKYQIVIPRVVREALKIKPGETIHVFQIGERIELVRAKPAKEMRGFLRGIDTTVPRDEDRV
jgi:AbrB family looped-hinge helix DNA binding protein